MFAHSGQFSFSMGAIGAVIFELNPFNKFNQFHGIEQFHGQNSADWQLKLR